MYLGLLNSFTWSKGYTKKFHTKVYTKGDEFDSDIKSGKKRTNYEMH